MAETQQCSLGALLACVLQVSSPEAAGAIFEIASLRHMGFMRSFRSFLGYGGHNSARRDFLRVDTAIRITLQRSARR